jgi:hypothetical protein
MFNRRLISVRSGLKASSETPSVFQTSIFPDQKFIQMTCYYESARFGLLKGLFHGLEIRGRP